MQISDVDFRNMLAELFDSDTPRFDSMCKIARDQLTPLVNKWCASNSILRDKGLEDEIIQKTSVRLMKYSITKFFYAQGADTPNTDPDEYCKWMFAIVKNVAKDEIKSAKAKSYADISELADFIPAEEEDYFAREDASHALERVVEAVVGLRVGVHKMLVWLLLVSASANSGAKNSVIISAIVKRYHGSSLNTLYSAVKTQFVLHPYLYLSATCKATIESALNRSCEGGTVGDSNLDCYFGQAEGKYCISDWVYKINLSVRRSFS